MPPEILSKMISKLNEYDVIVGSRYVKDGKDNRPFFRVITSRIINLIANIVLNFKVKDYDSGFIVTRKEVFEKVRFEPKGHGEYCIEFLYRCTKQGLRIKEIGYVFRDREEGVSKSYESFTGFMKLGLQYFIRIIKLRIEQTKLTELL